MPVLLEVPGHRNRHCTQHQADDRQGVSSQVYQIDGRITDMLEQTESLRELVMRVTPVLSDMPRADTNNAGMAERARLRYAHPDADDRAICHPHRPQDAMRGSYHGVRLSGKASHPRERNALALQGHNPVLWQAGGQTSSAAIPRATPAPPARYPARSPRSSPCRRVSASAPPRRYTPSGMPAAVPWSAAGKPCPSSQNHRTR